MGRHHVWIRDPVLDQHDRYPEASLERWQLFRGSTPTGNCGCSLVAPLACILALPSRRGLTTLSGWGSALDVLWVTFGPGGRLHPEGFIENNGHLVLEGLLVAVIGYLLFQRSYKPSRAKHDEPLTEKVGTWLMQASRDGGPWLLPKSPSVLRVCHAQEIDDLCEEWTPEPLWQPLTEQQKTYEPPIISRRAEGSLGSEV